MRLEAAVDFVLCADQKPVVWGLDDCCAWPAQWLKVCGVGGVALPDYSTPLEALRLIRKAGSLVDLCRDGLENTSLMEADPAYEDPAPGDVGVILSATAQCGAVGVIFLNHGIAAWRSERGFRTLHPRRNTIQAFWKVP